MSTPDVRLAAEDAVELAELLEVVSGLFGRPDGVLAWFRFVGEGFDAGAMRVDLARFVFLLGGTRAGLSGGLAAS